MAVTATVCRRCATADGDDVSAGVAQRRAGLFLTLDWFNPEIAEVSMVQLIATPERFHGKRVRFTGFVHFQFEGNGIYLHKEDHDQEILNDGLWIERPAGSTLNDVYVLVEGRFRADDRGHMGLFSGTLEDVTRMELEFGATYRKAQDAELL